MPRLVNLWFAVSAASFCTRVVLPCSPTRAHHVIIRVVRLLFIFVMATSTLFVPFWVSAAGTTAAITNITGN